MRETISVSARPFTSPILMLVTVATLVLCGCSRHSDSTDTSQASASPASPSSKQGWLTNYEEGQQEAQANNKLVLLNFTGSDWCGWCKLLDREVFSQPQFKEYANKNLVLVEVDFPKRKQIPDTIKNQNLQLAMRYQIQGFPTIVVLNGNGQVVGELGYMEGGPAVFIAQLERFRKG
jgi:thioredoxin-related protein